jgi:hypothetical protein
MINRGYVVMLDTTSIRQSALDLDIVVGLPGSPTAPVAALAEYPAAGVTPAPAGWSGGKGAYYEVRSRAIPFEKFSGQTGFTPRTRLGCYLSIVALQNSVDSALCSNLLPMLSLSASLGNAPGAGNAAVFGATYATVLADPSYGPVIRVHNSLLLDNGTNNVPTLYYVTFAIAEAKNEDFTPFGRG